MIAGHRAYYHIAELDDALAMDAVMLHYVMRRIVNQDRTSQPFRVRVGVKRTCNATEQAFMRTWETVRSGRAFQALVPGDQGRIKAVLFEGAPEREWRRGGSRFVHVRLAQPKSTFRRTYSKKRDREKRNGETALRNEYYASASRGVSRTGRMSN